MQIEIIKDELKIAGPLSYSKDEVTKILTRYGLPPQAIPDVYTVGMSIGEFLLLPVVIDSPPITAVETLFLESRVVSETDVTYTYSKQFLPIEVIRRTMFKHLSEIHEAYEAARAIWNNMYVNVDLEARITIKYYADLFKDGVISELEWRGKTKNVVDIPFSNEDGIEYVSARFNITSTEEMQNLEQTVLLYLQKGFIARNSIEDSINALDVNGLQSLDLETAWAAIVTPGE